MDSTEPLNHTKLVAVNPCETNIICLSFGALLFPTFSLYTRWDCHRSCCCFAKEAVFTHTCVYMSVQACACTPLCKIRQRVLLHISFDDGDYWRCLENRGFSFPKPTNCKNRISTVEQNCTSSRTGSSTDAGKIRFLRGKTTMKYLK